MADADEDLIPSLDPSRHSRGHAQSVEDADSDSDASSDGVPDYRFLTTTTASRRHALPSRGTKDFEPLPNSRQSSTLGASRQAMKDALSVTRVHTTPTVRKNENVGVYFHDERMWDAQVFEQEVFANMEDPVKRGKAREASLMKKGEGRCVALERFTSTFTRTMGRTDRRNWTWLLPEEALFLLERGSIDIRYEVREEEENKQRQPILNHLGIPTAESADQIADSNVTGKDQSTQLKISDIPLSLQGAYAAFMGKSGLTLERYVVYTNLRRAGYIVQRAPTWYAPLEYSKKEGQADANALAHEADNLTAIHKTSQPSSSSSPTALIYRLLSYLLPSITTPKPLVTRCHNRATGPLVSPGLFWNYFDIFRQLHLIPTHDTPSPVSKITQPPLNPTYTLHKPTAITSYRKSSPQPPNYHIVVLNARTTTIPTSASLGALLSSLPDDTLENAERKRLENRIKHGTRNVIMAVVDCGLVSYLRVSGGGFGSETWLWGENERRGRMGRGGKGSRGRGMGRGRRGGGRGRGGSTGRGRGG